MEIDNIANITEILGGAATSVDMKNTSDAFQTWNTTDGWFGANGATQWGNNSIVYFKPNADGTFKEIGMYPTCVGGETASCTYRYYNSITAKSYDVIINVTIETPPAVEYNIVRTYQKTYSLVNPEAGITPEPKFSINDLITEIQTLIGGAPDKILMSNSESEFQLWNSTDGWFGANGAAGWGTQAQMFCLKPNADGTFIYCAAINNGECNAQCTYRYINTATSKAVDVEITIALTAPVVAD